MQERKSISPEILPFLNKKIASFKEELRELSFDIDENALIFESDLRYKVWGKSHPVVSEIFGDRITVINRINKFFKENFLIVNNDNLVDFSDFLMKAAKTLYLFYQDSRDLQRIAFSAHLISEAINGAERVRIVCGSSSCKVCQEKQSSFYDICQELEKQSLPCPGCECDPFDCRPEPVVDDNDNLIYPSWEWGFCSCIYITTTVSKRTCPTRLWSVIEKYEVIQKIDSKKRREVRDQMLAEGWNDSMKEWSTEFRHRMGDDSSKI